VALGTLASFVVAGAMCGSGIVRITPALVPIHSRSLQARSDVTRRHAALCCRIMSSQPEHVRNMRLSLYGAMKEYLKKQYVKASIMIHQHKYKLETTKVNLLYK
jgi:hypothetical protein